jgi:hypothetical protein
VGYVGPDTVDFVRMCRWLGVPVSTGVPFFSANSSLRSLFCSMISSRIRRGYFELLVLVVREVVADVLPHALVDPHTRSYRILSLAPR